MRTSNSDESEKADGVPSVFYYCISSYLGWQCYEVNNGKNWLFGLSEERMFIRAAITLMDCSIINFPERRDIISATGEPFLYSHKLTVNIQCAC